jgi:hypothetical protein
VLTADRYCYIPHMMVAAPALALLLHRIWRLLLSLVTTSLTNGNNASENNGADAAGSKGKTRDKGGNRRHSDDYGVDYGGHLGIGVLGVLVSIVLGSSISMTFAQVSVWADSRSLWTHVTRINPADGQAIFLHAKALTDDVEKLGQRIARIQAAVAAGRSAVLPPMWSGNGRRLQETNGGGNAAAASDDVQVAIESWREKQSDWVVEALELYATAAKLAPHATALTAYADALAATGRAQEAEITYGRAIELDGGASTTALLNLGSTFTNQVSCCPPKSAE